MLIKSSTSVIFPEVKQEGEAVIYRNGAPFYSRFVTPQMGPIKVNFAKPGNYTATGPIDVEKGRSLGYLKPDIVQGFDPVPQDRNRYYGQPVEIRTNPELDGTPARIFTLKNPVLIEVAPWFNALPEQQKEFIILHELSHLNHATEMGADAMALNLFAARGGNVSQAFYALSNILHKGSPENQERIKQAQKFASK